MKNLLKNLGPILMIIGVVILAVYFFSESNSNVYLASAGIIMLFSIILHIILNKES
jgi:membrane protein YdbS with pleckstrin-like domain